MSTPASPRHKATLGLMPGSALYQSICSSKGWLKSQPCCFGVSAMQHLSASAFIYSLPTLEPHSHHLARDQLCSSFSKVSQP